MLPMTFDLEFIYPTSEKTQDAFRVVILALDNIHLSICSCCTSYCCSSALTPNNKVFASSCILISVKAPTKTSVPHFLHEVSRPHNASTSPADPLEAAAIMTTQQGKVKSVLSGDTVVLSAVHNPKSERIFSFAYVTAPRLRREGDEVREPPMLCFHHVDLRS